MTPKPQLGAGLIIIDQNKILLAQRQGSHDQGIWGSAGGHVDFGETPKQTVIREAKEELGITVHNLKFLCILSMMIDNKQYLDIGFTAQIKSGTPRIMELHKISEVKWFDKDNLPSPLFPPIKSYLQALKTGKQYFESH